MSDFLEHLGIHPSASDTGRPGDDAALAVTPTDEHANVNGGVHGGLVATLLDATMGRAVRSSLGEDQQAVTVSMTVTFLKGAKVGQELQASSELRKQGDSLCMVEADVVTAEENVPIAHGIATFSIVDS